MELVSAESASTMDAACSFCGEREEQRKKFGSSSSARPHTPAQHHRKPQVSFATTAFSTSQKINKKDFKRKIQMKYTQK